MSRRVGIGKDFSHREQREADISHRGRREADFSHSQDQSWNDMMQRRANMKVRRSVPGGSSADVQFKLESVLKRFNEAAHEMVVLDRQIRSRQERDTSSRQYGQNIDKSAGAGGRTTGPAASRSTAGADNRVVRNEDASSQIWRMNAHTFVQSSADDNDWKRLVERRRKLKQTFCLQRGEMSTNGAEPPGPEGGGHNTGAVTKRDVYTQNINTWDRCESIGKTLVCGKPCKPEETRHRSSFSSSADNLKRKFFPSFGKVGCETIIAETSSDFSSEGEPIQKLVVKHLRTSNYSVYITPILSESLGNLAKRSSVQPVKLSPTFHLSSSVIQTYYNAYLDTAAITKTVSPSYESIQPQLEASRPSLSLQTTKVSVESCPRMDEHRRLEDQGIQPSSQNKIEECTEDSASQSSRGTSSRNSGCSSRSSGSYSYSSYEYTDEDESECEEGSSDSGVGLSESTRGSSESTRRKVLTKRSPSFKTNIQGSIDPYSAEPLPEFSPREIEAANRLRDWVDYISRPSSNPVKELQEKYGDLFPTCTQGPPPEPRIRRVSGETDELGQYNGEAEIYYENGDYFWGDLEHGSKEGMASLVLENGDNLMGRFKHNHLNGFVQENIGFCDRDNVVREVFYRNGVRHGFYRELGPNKQFWCFGRFINGSKVGTHWRWGRGGVFNVGEVDKDNKPLGDSNLYLYPDLLTVLEGDYQHGKLKTGRLVKLKGVSKEYGIPVPEISKVCNQRTYSYEPSTANIITKSPMLRDPYEERYVFVSDSSVPMAGEGLYAKTSLKAGQLCALFNGVRQRHLCGVKGDNSNREWSDYRISVEPDMDMDIRKEHECLSNYRATLGHKTCHSFNPNAYFAQVWNPRFGLLMSIVTSEEIEQGEEIQVSYNYDIQKSPEWYQNLWFDHVRYSLDWTEAEVYSWASKLYNKSGIPVNVSPPHRGSSRFVGCGVCGEHVGPDSSSVSCEHCESWIHIPCTDINLQEALDLGQNYTWFCKQCK